MSYKSLAISLSGVGKEYHIYEKPSDRLRAMMPWNRNHAIYKTFHALKDIDLEIGHGEVVGIVGRNGAGKSTLLQIVAKTLAPSYGHAMTDGNVSALLELGSGFNPDFTGRENVFLAAAIAGLSAQEAKESFESIINFSEIGEFIDQPVKTYSSGMLVRLAFSVATSVKPDILIVDEALSVGDGAFARKSFDRIMELKEKGCTILFCSHNMYQIEMICNKVLWLSHGKIEAFGQPASVIKAYEADLLSQTVHHSSDLSKTMDNSGKSAYFTQIHLFLDDAEITYHQAAEGKSSECTLRIEAEWISNPEVGAPNLAVTIHTKDGRMVGSAGSHIDGITFERDLSGRSRGHIRFPKLPLLKGEYEIELYLLCDKGIFFYDQRVPAARFIITQDEKDTEQGLVRLARIWE